jgi:hypothetical protein
MPLEIKSTTKENFSMSGAALQRLRSFADAFKLPLLFAVRFLQHRSAAIWVIAEDANRAKPSVKISLSDWIRGLRPVLWNEFAYAIMPRTLFQVTYSRDIRGENVRHPDYGEQIALRIVTNQRSHDIGGPDSVLPSAFFDAYYLTETKVEHEGSFARVTYSPKSQAMSIADIIYRMNRFPTDDDGRLTYHARTAIRELADGCSASLVTRAYVEGLGNRMCKEGVLGIVGYGEPRETYRKWLATGGQE